MTIDLRSDGKCTFALEVRSNLAERMPCTYWIHGGGIRLRALGERMGEGLNKLEIEHLRDSDTLVILGERRIVLSRRRTSL